jgi:hypothetical protein
LTTNPQARPLRITERRLGGFVFSSHLAVRG